MQTRKNCQNFDSTKKGVSYPVLTRHAKSEIRRLAREGRSFVRIDSECAEGEEYAEMIGPQLSTVEGVESVKIVHGLFRTDFPFSVDGKLEYKHEHCWLLVNDTLIVDVGSDEFNALAPVFKKIELIDVAEDTRHETTKIQDISEVE